MEYLLVMSLSGTTSACICILLGYLMKGRISAGMVLSHEFVHIKRFDVFWKILFRLVVILHWWNPAVWLIRRNLEWSCECSCDDIVLHGKTKEERKAYMRLLIGESSRNGQKEAGAYAGEWV